MKVGVNVLGNTKQVEVRGIIGEEAISRLVLRKEDVDLSAFGPCVKRGIVVDLLSS